MSKLSKSNPQEMVRVSKELFTDGIPLPVEVYTRLPSGQFILVGKKNEPCNLSKLHLSQQANADYFVRHIEYPSLVKFNISMVEKTIKNDALSPNVKMGLLKGVAESAIFDLMEKDMYVGSYEACKQLASFVQETAAQIKDIDKFIDIFSKLPGDMVSHALVTSMIALMISEEMNITMKTTLEKVVMGGLLHDVGLKEIPQSILSKPRLEWNEEELIIYESHTLRGVELLRNIKEIPSDVLSIVLEHHENALGYGYPRHVRDIKINPLARIVAVADCFVDLIYDSHEGPRRTPDEAVNFIENHLGQPFNKPAFLGLKKVLHKSHVQKKLKGTG